MEAHFFVSDNQVKAAPPSKSSEIEKSSHFLTTDVAGVRRWSKFKDNIQIVFEIFGKNNILFWTYSVYFKRLRVYLWAKTFPVAQAQ